MIDFLLDSAFWLSTGLLRRDLVGPGRSCQRWARILLAVLAALALSVWLVPELTGSPLVIMFALIIAALFGISWILTLAHAADKDHLSNSISSGSDNDTAPFLSRSGDDPHKSGHNNEVVPTNKPRHTEPFSHSPNFGRYCSVLVN